MHDSILMLREEWLATKTGLSKRTLSSYSGEIARFDEFCRGRGVRRAAHLSAALWGAYLAELRSGRSGTRSKRVDNLNENSARQAHRITRSFLNWLSDERRIGWRAPKATPHAPAPDRSSRGTRQRKGSTLALRPTPLPPMLTEALAGQATEGDLRRQIVVNLLFWAALKPSELVLLPVESLGKVSGGLACIRPPGAQLARFAPAHLWHAWLRYRQVRERRQGAKLSAQEPLLCTLHGSEVLTPWTIWSIVRSTGVDFANSPRELRLEYLRRLTEDTADGLKTARVACGLQNLQPYMNASSSRVSESRINELLLRVSGLLAIA